MLRKTSQKPKKWFERSARKGFVDAEFMMGHMHQNGWGVKPDGYRALSWYKRAAKKGKIEAQFMTGYMFMSGEAGEEQAVKGYAWTEVSFF